MNRGETKKNRWKGPRERSFSAPPQPFSCLTSVQLFAQLHYSCIFLQNTSEKHTKKKPAGDLPTFCPPCQGLAKTSKVWVQTNIFSHKEVTWSRDQKYLQFSERLDGHFDLWGWNFSLWLVITIVHFVFREEIPSESKYQDIAWLSRLEVLEADELSLLPRLLCQTVRNPDDVVLLENMLDIPRWLRWFIFPRRH